MSHWNLNNIPPGKKEEIRELKEQGKTKDLFDIFEEYDVIPQGTCYSCAIVLLGDWVIYYLESFEYEQ